MEEALFEAYRGALLARTRRWMGNEAQAEDLVPVLSKNGFGCERVA